MGTYLHLYGTRASHDADYNGPAYAEPWVANTVETGEVTYNKPRYRFDDIVGDISKYSAGSVFVVDNSTRYGDMFTIALSSEPQAVQDIVEENEIVSNAMVNLQEALDIPDSGNFVLVTKRRISDESGFEIDNTRYDIMSVSMLEGTYDIDWYLYDYGTMVRHTITQKSSDLNPAFPVGFVPSEADQRSSSKNKVSAITVDVLQHVHQISSYDFNANMDLNGYVTLIPSSNRYQVKSLASTDLVSGVSTDSDEDGNVQVSFITTETLFNGIDGYYISDVFEEEPGTWTYKFEVDNVEVWSSTVTVDSTHVWGSSHGIYDGQNGGWSAGITFRDTMSH